MNMAIVRTCEAGTSRDTFECSMWTWCDDVYLKYTQRLLIKQSHGSQLLSRSGTRTAVMSVRHHPLHGRPSLASLLPQLDESDPYSHVHIHVFKYEIFIKGFQIKYSSMIDTWNIVVCVVNWWTLTCNNSSSVEWFEVLAAVNMKMAVLWVVTPCRLVYICKLYKLTPVYTALQPRRQST
jgi:hypothetical protein